MNSIMERWVGSCRRELLDRTLVWNQRHLMIVLREYEDFYNTHRAERAGARPTTAARGLGPDWRANVEQTWPRNGLHEVDRNGYNARSERVRREGLEPPTRGLRVRCSAS